MSAEKSAIEVELRSMGASHPSLWIALFDVNQAIHSSKPLPEMPDWNSVCSTVQDLYRLSLKDPREFAVAQTLTTIMHQHQAKEEILNRVSAIDGGPTDAPETSERPKDSLQPSEIQKELESMCSKVEELGKAVEDFKNAVEMSNKDIPPTSTEPFIIPQIVVSKIDSFLEQNLGWFSTVSGLNSEWGRQELEKAKAIATPEVSADIIFVLYLMVTNGPIFSYFSSGMKYKLEIEITMEVVRTAYKDAFPFPRSNIYQDIRRALEASFIIKRVPDPESMDLQTKAY